MRAGEVVSGGLQVVLQGLGGRVFVDTFDTPTWEGAGEVTEQCEEAGLAQEPAILLPQGQQWEAKFYT